MALFYNAKILEEQATCDNEKMLALLEYHWSKKIPKNLRVKFFPSPVNLAGQSFLINPADFFNDKNTDILYRIQYLKLTGLRDYNLYKQYKYVRLNKSYFPDIRYDDIKYNPLLKITQTEILFKYEER